MTKPNPADAGSGAVVAARFPEPPIVPLSPWGAGRPRLGDRIFRRLSEGSGVLMIVLVAAIGGFLLYRAVPALQPVATWLNHTLGWCFLFASGNASTAGGGTIFTGGIVLAVMILPIIAAVTREVFVQTPHDQIEAALALGATRWEVVKTTVLP